MANKAWRMNEEDKIKVGEYILDTIKNNGEFPRTARDGKAIMDKLCIQFEGDVTGVLFHENDADGLMHVAVPPREIILEMIEKYENYPYKIPETYVELANGTSSLPDEKKAYAFRIGDYTISHCG